MMNITVTVPAMVDDHCLLLDHQNVVVIVCYLPEAVVRYRNKDPPVEVNLMPTLAYFN